MSFDFNPVGNLSNVQASAKSCPGGGGNTGYFQRGKKEDDDTPHFKEELDCFEKVELEDIQEIEEKESFSEFLKKALIKIIVKLRRIFKKKK